MGWQHQLIFFIAFGIGLPAAFRSPFSGKPFLRNPTPLALLASWVAAEIWWIATGNSIAVSVYFMTDIAVIAVILAKSIIRAGRASSPDITLWDKAILGLFVFAAWPAYIAANPLIQFWVPWATVVLQFLLAGTESFLGWRKAVALRKAETRSADIIPFILNPPGKLVPEVRNAAIERRRHLARAIGHDR